VKNVRLESHVVIDGKTRIGDETRVYPFVSIGLAPQDLSIRGEPTATEIGKRNHIREFVTVTAERRRRRHDAHRRR
jgi:UDP-N-acetylglucosamine acyltransferase